MNKVLLSRMQGLCCKKEYSVGQIKEKLFKAGLNETEAGEVVASLLKDKYIDEERYARAYVRDKAVLNGWGDAKIRHILLQEGIASEYIDAAFESLDGAEREAKIEKVLKGKMKSLKVGCRTKLLRFALSRGFSYEQVNPLICRLLDEKE